MRLLSGKIAPFLFPALVMAVLIGRMPAFAQVPPAQPTAPAAAPQTSASLAAQAQDLEKRFQWEDAAALYAQAADLDLPKQPLQAATDLDSEASDEEKQSKHDAATASYARALALQEAGGDATGQATSLLGSATIDEDTSTDTNALPLLTKALSLMPRKEHLALKAEAFRLYGVAYDDLSQPVKALDDYAQALSIFRDAGDKNGQARVLKNIGNAYDDLSQPAKALDYYAQALPLYKDAGDKDGQARALGSMGIAYDHLSQPAKALTYYAQALPIYKAIGDKDGQANALLNVGNAHDDLGQPIEALDDYAQALPLFKATGDKEGQASMLVDTDNAYENLSRPVKALSCYAQAMPLFRATGDKIAQAKIFLNTGNNYSDLSRPAKALSYYAQAMPLYKAAGDKDGQAHAFLNAGNAYNDLSQSAKALDCYAQALPLYKDAGDKDGQAKVLLNTGDAYLHLSQPAKALDYYAQALPIYKAIGDKDGQANALLNVSNAHDDLSQSAKALDYYAQALTLYKAVGDIDGQANASFGVGDVYLHRARPAKALDCYAQALPLFQAAEDKHGQASVFSSTGDTYLHMARPAQALACYVQALPLYKNAGDTDSLASTFGGLMNASAKFPRRARLAILYGKQAVNLYQGIRGGLTKLNQSLQQSYLKDKEPTYRKLADLLIQQGRLAEAQQILHLLKQREFYDFLNENPGSQNPNAATLDTLALTRREAEWSARYDQASRPLARIGDAQQALDTGNALTLEQQAQKTKLDHQYAAVSAAARRVQDKTAQDFSGSPTADDAPPGLVQAALLARSLPPGTALLDTIVGTDALRLILVTQAKTIAYTSPITSEKLYRLVFALRQDLMHPDRDPRPRTARLYALVLGPAQRDLDRFHIKTILFSLDDALRYIPPAALYNAAAKKYVAQVYDTEVITLAIAPEARLAAKPSLLGLGVSLTQDGQPSLPGVKRELTVLVRSAGDPSGLVPGKALLDAAFTRAAMTNALRTRRYPWVHVASHFALHPSETDSYLLLGDGTKMTVAELRQDPRRFAGVEMLTLSACDTAMEEKASSGREVEGFGVLAQRLGARNVVASLWPVSDTTTPLLMVHLYRWRRDHPGGSLAEALRQAQLSLMTSLADAPQAPVQEAKARGTVAVSFSHDFQAAPKFEPDPKAPYAHPYYWAPFILIGNWK